ncbi:MAG: Gfo/Idh/MocA family oxidoreductase [bacterium]|nr:Gfo/Idh/MocA family oxidoreductase [bacterium]
MEEEQQIRWGILGLGKIARKFTSDLKTLPGAKLQAVASRDLMKSRGFALEFGAESAYGSYEELAQDPEVDVVYIATPHVFHSAYSLLCLNHKKAVLCEKPFAMDSDEVTEMIDCAKANNVFLMEAMWTRFLPHYQYVLDLVSKKKFGEVISVEADFGFKAAFDPENRVWKKELGGGSLLDVGIYPIFAALSILGYPNEVLAAGSFAETSVDRETKVLFSYSNEQTAVLRSSLAAHTPTEAIIYCENGTIKLNTRFHEPTTVSLITEDSTSEKSFDYDTIGYSYEAQHVMECLWQGKKESPLMAWQDSLELISLLDEVRIQIGLQY